MNNLLIFRQLVESISIMCNVCPNFAVVSRPIAGPMSTISLVYCLLSQSHHGAMYSIGTSLYRYHSRYIHQIKSCTVVFNLKIKTSVTVRVFQRHHHHLHQHCPRHNFKKIVSVVHLLLEVSWRPPFLNTCV